MEYLATIDNVKAVVKFVNKPKSAEKGYSYKLNIEHPPKEIEDYLDKYNGITYYPFPMDKEPRFSTNQHITIAKLGISQWEDDSGEIRYSAHIISPKKDEKIEPIKEEIIPEESDENKWLTYRQRLEEILSLFKEKECNADTALAGAVLGLRELMFGNNRR